MKKLIIIIMGFFLIALPALAIDLYQGEVINIWIEVGERADATFTIQSASFEVMDRDGTVLQANATATIDSVDMYVYGLVDTSAAAFTSGLSAQVKFTFIIDTETYIYFVPIKIYEYSQN